MKHRHLLNLGPRCDGAIEPEQVKVLQEIGRRIRKDGFPKADAIRARSQQMIDRKLLADWFQRHPSY